MRGGVTGEDAGRGEAGGEEGFVRLELPHCQEEGKNRQRGDEGLQIETGNSDGWSSGSAASTDFFSDIRFHPPILSLSSLSLSLFTVLGGREEDKGVRLGEERREEIGGLVVK